MRRSIQYISSIFLAAVLLFSGACTREDLTPTPPGDRVALSEFGINYQIDGAEVYTKIALNERTENAVRNLYVLLFAEDGSLIHSKRYLVTNATNLPEDQATRYDAVLNSYYERDEGDSRLSSGIIPGFFSGYNFTDASCLEGNLTFYAIANYSQSVGDNLKAIKNKTELEDFTVDITHGSVERNYLFMVAAEEGVNLSPSTDNYGNITVERIGTNLRLRRLDARITFKIDIDIDGATDINFTNAIYRVHQIPNTSYLIEKSKTNNNTGTENTWDAANNYSCMDDDNFAYFDRFEGTSGDFTFYMRENRPVPKVRITHEARTNENNTGKKEYDNLYVMREAWWNDASGITDETPVHEREFTYAPENSTFVEISGNLEYKRYNQETQSDEYVSGYVTYIVHLGETGDRYDYNNEDAVNNYDIRRNVRYTYNMRITGIHSFEIEVKADGAEKRPGAEGNFSISNSQQFTMDAHYGRLLLELDMDSILGLDEDGDGQQDGAGWNVSSPPLATTIFDGTSISAPYNYKWILFAINKEFGGNDTQMVKFPGIQAYDGGLKFHDGHTPDTEEILNDIGNKIIDRNNDTVSFKEYLLYDRDNYYSGINIDEDACLRDINQLLRHLYKEALAEKDGDENLFTTRIGSDGKRKVTITAFCDEFTYVYELEKEDYRHPGTSLDPVKDKEVLLYWKRYVNQDDRVMNITPMTATDVSADKNTSITHSFVSISQKSIKTIYNENDPDLETAWGLETINETGPLTYRTNDGNGKDPLNRGILGINENTTSDGRTNFLNFWLTGNPNENILWSDVMTVSQRIENAEGLTEDYRNAFHACMTRNRDLNGNDKIDEDEIYWYLASQDQLSGLYIGQPALEEDSWMYTGDGSQTNHLITSSLYNKDGYRFVRTNNGYESNIPNFWILWSEEGASWGRLRAGGDEITGVTEYDYRCIRNLGIPTSVRTAPTHYASIEDKGDYYTIDVSVVNQRALRSSADQGDNLPFDNERSLSNRPFKSFDVRDGFYPTNGYIKWNEMKDDIIRNENPCPLGWRVPNQKEILIMMSLIGEDNFELTTMYYDYYGNPNYYPLGIATSFSYNGSGLYKDNLRVGFFYSNPNLVLLNNTEPNDVNMKIRCVRDHTDN